MIQGDTLSTFLADARQIVAELRAGNQPIDDARDLADRLGELLDHYAQTLTKEGPSIGR